MRIMLLGSGGYVGQRLKPFLKEFGMVYAPDRTEMNLTDKAEVMDRFALFLPDLVINTAGVSNPDLCEQNISLSSHSNVVGAYNLACACKAFDARLFHLSSCSASKITNVYAKHKYYAEEYILAEKILTVLFRCDKIYGDGDDFTNEILEKLEAHSPHLANDGNIRYPLYIDDLIGIILQAIKEHKWQGIINLRPHKGYTKYQWEKLIARIHGFSANKIIPDKFVDPSRLSNWEITGNDKIIYTTELLEGLKQDKVKREEYI